MLEESRMEKKSLNRTSQPQSRASAIDCKKNTESTPRPWPRNNKKREGPGSTPKNEPNRKNAPPQYGRGQYDRRSRTRGSTGYHVGGTQNTRLGRDEEPEIGSVFVPGSKKQNMNHLLNFTYPSRGLPEHRGHQVRRPGFQNRGPSRHGHDHYLRAYCQFVIKEDGDIKANLLDPDIPLKWDHIEEVVVRATGRSKCLICLGPPAAGRVYRCGHIYCWACILHYAATHDKQPPPCPMCSTPLHVDDMKPIRIVEWEPETEEVTMRLVRRLRGSTAVEMAPPRGQVIEAMPPILPLENINKAPYTKMFSATKQQIHEILIRERHEIENQILAEIDTTEIVYLEQALEMLKSKEENINLRFSEPKLTINEETEAVVPTVYEKLEENQNKLDWFDVNEEGAAACAEIMKERTCDAGMGDTNEKDRASPKNLELLDENEAGAACVDIIHNNMGALNLNTVDSNLNPEAPSFDIDEMQPEEFPLTECIVQETKQLEDNATTAMPVSALVKGVSHRYLTVGKPPEWRTSGYISIQDGSLCGLQEGMGKVRALFGGVWSPEVEVQVFPSLAVVPRRARVPPAARLQLRHAGGPPPHLARLHYALSHGPKHVEVTPSGSVHGLSIGTSRIKLVAIDFNNVEMASAEAEVEVVPISGIRVKAATQSLLVGSPSPLWIEAGGLSAAALAALMPPPRVTWTLRDPATARLYTTHADDMLERSVAEGLSVRVVPLKPGVIAIDVRVRNMGQAAETRSWDSTIEILGLADIRTSVEGLSKEISSGDRLALAVSSVIKLKSLPRGTWKAYGDGAITISPAGELTAIRPGHGVIVAQHKDERNNIFRETAIQVEVSVPWYCTLESSGESPEAALRLVLRSPLGRALLAPHANVSAAGPLIVHNRPARHTDSVLGTELVIPDLDVTGAFMTFQGTVSGVTVKDEVLVTGTDVKADRVVATGSWGVCVEGAGWRAPGGVALYVGGAVSLALLARPGPATHVLRRDRPQHVFTLHQLQLDKMEFLPGEWASELVPLSFTASGLSSGPLLCTEEQRYALEGTPIELPYTCRTKAPHTAEPVIDVINGQMGCKIIPAATVTDASEVELCAEWGTYRTCTKTLLLPQVRVSTNKVSLLNPPATFTVMGHSHALKLVRLTPSPGLKIETRMDNGDLLVTVTNEASTCGYGWVTVRSKRTSQELRVDVQRECDVACGTLLGALFSLLKPYMSTIVTVAAAAAGYLYVQQRMQRKAPIRMPTDPNETVLPPEVTPIQNRSRTWSRSPYASSGPTAPVYGDASMLPEQSFSPNSTRNSMFL